MLKDLLIADNYSSDDSNILEDLFRPCLQQSDVYYRSVGFLDSKVLAHLAREFEAFSKRGGHARLLVGRTVSVEDYLAIKRGKLNPDRFLSVPDIDSLWSATRIDETKKRGLLVLSWLVARGAIQVRFSLRPAGLHHDKFAYFRDSTSNEVVLHGTNNETEAASLPEFNYESLSVFKSWESEIFARHGEYKLREFLRLWEGTTKGSISIDAPHPTLEKIAALSATQRRKGNYQELFQELHVAFERFQALPRIPAFLGQSRYKLYKHQKKAIDAYFDNDYRGIFALATGSGKTITALHAVTLLAREIATANEVDVFVLVSVPYQVLGDQWVENARIFGYGAIAAYGSVDNWYDPLTNAINRATFEPGPRVTFVVAVNRTLGSDAFRNLIGQVAPLQLIFIGDECHRLGSLSSRGKLPNAEYRLGLSATPWAPHEEELKEALTAYFGGPIAFYGLEHAFDDGVLVPYEYRLHEVSLTEEESEDYETHTGEVKKLQAIKLNGGSINEDTLNYHLNERARILGSAAEKFQALPEVLRKVNDQVGLTNLLVYCGSGSTDESSENAEAVRDIERAQRVAAEAVNLESARITAAESARVRRSILKAFESGALQAIFAIRVLDEGFDMPGVMGAILLASSRNERQFIQRRGRVLRVAPKKEKAFIWDFIIVGGATLNREYSTELIEQELSRAIEFGRMALGWDEIKEQLRGVAESWDVDFEVLYQRVCAQRYEVDSNG